FLSSNLQHEDYLSLLWRRPLFSYSFVLRGVRREHEGPSRKYYASEGDIPKCTDPDAPGVCCATINLKIPDYTFTDQINIAVPGGWKKGGWPTEVELAPQDSKGTNSKGTNGDLKKFNVVAQISCDPCQKWSVSTIEWKEKVGTNNGEGWYKLSEDWYDTKFGKCPDEN
ncbi:hypothetical protein MPER_04178, partial [Moniliophthora perniciosa FA553]